MMMKKRVRCWYITGLVLIEQDIVILYSVLFGNSWYHGISGTNEEFANVELLRQIYSIVWRRLLILVGTAQAHFPDSSNLICGCDVKVPKFAFSCGGS